MQGNDKNALKVEASKLQSKESIAQKTKYDLKTRKFEEKMPKMDQIKLSPSQYDTETLLKQVASAVNSSLNGIDAVTTQDESISEYIKSDSEAFMGEFNHNDKSQFPEISQEVCFQTIHFL